MAKPYSEDFRQKVINAIELDGHKKCEVSEIFNISRNTIDLWLKRKGVALSPNSPDLVRAQAKSQTGKNFVSL